MASSPPIGYVIRRLDGLITRHFERALDEHGVTRRQWQALNALAEEPATLDELDELLAPFLDRNGGETVRAHLEPLADDGLLTLDGERCVLTERGRGLAAALRVEVEMIRRRVVSGIAEDDYERTVRTLQRMAANLAGG